MSNLSTYQADVGPVDVAIIGAGINGLAIAREAAAIGLSVALLDRADIGSATSAISTRLIHGGLKYLERFELNLVHESIRERKLLLREAPHLVKPYSMLIPFSKKQSRPGWMLACGLMLHDVLAAGKKLPFNSILLKSRLKREWPTLAAAGLSWGGLFQDAHVPLTERLNIELARDAAAHGAIILTHAPVVGLVRSGGNITGVRYRDRITANEKSVAARLVVNAAGPWVDSVLDLAGEHERKIGPTKGSHLVIDTFPGAPKTCIFFESPVDSRPMFVLPWQGRYMIGTTDLPYSGDIDHVAIDDDEIDYLLGAVNDLIPTARLTPEDVLWSYSGVRPLPYVGDLDDPAKVTRDHQIIEHAGNETGLYSIVGGKLTTHRALGEQVARKLARRLGRSKRPSPTRMMRFPGAPDGPWESYRTEFIQSSKLSANVAARLVDTYGTAASTIERLATDVPELAEIVDDETSAIAAEIIYAVRCEGAVTLEDILLRRTTIALNRDVGLNAASKAADVLVAEGEWTPDYAQEQRAAYVASMARFRPRPLQNQIRE
ncbi:glycerol-3-phosphate dehydrogenase [Paramicrobacterium agarici]|uniref:Glycerol-3-phosphate dehydrogenase n=1 Tax=Paramicrobacterium agarici TaxID=630514 RepID=A0A2A9DTG0_9MICO|nr:glycerol-3-phosphate dehydrogenase [Microbacterium agarici]PFG29883.1 glycerol-3-phosphate dehydrogenase [Microbacterium agarici]